MGNLETIFILLFAAILLMGIAQKFHIPYPITLVLGGTFIGFIPYIHPIYFDPNLILILVLPPVLYYAAFGISFREFRKNWRDIFSLALSLVAVTTFIIGIIFKWMFPEFPWALAFAFGAIVSPPDAVAVTAILKRFAISPRLAALLEGESLINDASALVLYKLALTALFAGTFSLFEGGLQFFKIVGGGIVVGFVLGFLFQLFSRRYLEPVLGVVFSFVIPYTTYIVATFLEVSGVLAVVINGLIGSRILASHYSSLRRVIGYATWDIFIILVNCFVFILMGLQLRTITSALTMKQMFLYTGFAFLITFALVVIRMLWVYGKSGINYLKALNDSRSSAVYSQIWREGALIGWSGMRGVVSLAAAIALPFYYPNGMPLEGRNEIIFITFVVILLTLLIPGLSLPYLIHWLKISHHFEHGDVGKARVHLTEVAQDKLQHLLHSKKINEVEFDFLNSYFIAQTRVQEMAHAAETQLDNLEIARITVIQAQRKKLLDLWKLNEIDDKVLTHLENELDMVEVHIARAELK